MNDLIQTSRLFLRPLTECDVSQKYVNWLNDSEVNQYLETRHSVQTIKSCSEFVERCNCDDSQFLFGIFLRESGEHIGNAKLGAINEHYGIAQLSLFIGEKSQWGMGYAKEVVHSLTEYGFNHLGLARIEAGCYEDNLSSLRIFLNAGYTVEGFFRNYFISKGKRVGCFWLAILKHEVS